MRRWLVRLGAVTAAGVFAFGPGGTAWAASPVPLNPAHVGATAAGFPTQDCAGPLGDLDPDEDGWNFVLPASAGDEFVSIQLTFNTPTPIVVTIDSPNPSNPSEGPGWSGYIDNAGGSESDKHAYLITEAGWTLTGGVAQVDPTGSTGQFNLSNTCPGTAGTPRPTPSAVKPSGGAGTGGGGSQGGTDGVALGVGVLALAGAAGVGVVVARRRRHVA